MVMSIIVVRCRRDGDTFRDILCSPGCEGMAQGIEFFDTSLGKGDDRVVVVSFKAKCEQMSS